MLVLLKSVKQCHSDNDKADSKIQNTSLLCHHNSSVTIKFIPTRKNLINQTYGQFILIRTIATREMEHT